jgi:hypothetical protein
VIQFNLTKTCMPFLFIHEQLALLHANIVALPILKKNPSNYNANIAACLFY